MGSVLNQKKSFSDRTKLIDQKVKEENKFHTKIFKESMSKILKTLAWETMIHVSSKMISIPKTVSFSVLRLRSKVKKLLVEKGRVRSSTKNLIRTKTCK